MSKTPVFTTYTYHGPVQSVALNDKDADGNTLTFFDETLYPGKNYLLPAGHKLVLRWIAMGLLKEVNNG